METEQINQEQERAEKYYRRYHSRAGRVLAGLVVIGAGTVLFMSQWGVPIPAWVFTWQMLVITIGLFIGAKHLFRGYGWMIPILVGGLFMIDEVLPGFDLRPYFWPIVIISIGLVMILTPGKRYWERRYGRKKRWERFQHYRECHDSTGDRIESVSVFGGVKKKIISKNFKGGEITCVFGGAEIDMSQADIQGKVELEINQVFGGTRLIVPAHWQILPEMVAVLGGIEDKRSTGNTEPDPEKIVVLRGTSVFGGLEIKSF